ncbi:MAG: polysaccharide lyase family 8 super-sandwich domain-containing protein, partial [Planctomycetota bacterium]
MAAILSAAEKATAAGDDLATVKTRLVALIAPNEAAAHSQVQKAAGLLKTQKDDGSWPDIDYKNANRANWLASSHVSRLNEMARGYYASRLLGQPDSQLHAGIVKGLDAWFTRDPKNPNWWHNQIGVPQTMASIFLLLGPDAVPAQKPKAVEILKRATWEKWTGQNLVWGVNIQIARGCLEESAATVAAGFERFYREIRIGIQPQEGVMADWSFHQHGNVIYSGGYGEGFSSDCARLVYCASGTRFEAPAEKLRILCNYVLDGQQWMVRGSNWDFGVVGREFTRKNKNARGLVFPAQLLAKLATPRQEEFKAFAARLEGQPGATPLSGNRHYWCSDFMVHHRPAFYASARMYSTRNDNTDSLTNDENKRSHFIADGAFCLMQSGAEYAGIYPVWDWQKIPGITCEQREQMPEPAKCRTKGQTAFAGGVSDGTYGVAALDFKRESLAARKAWFFFDDAVVCLGAGIACQSERPVATCVNQCLLKGAARSSVEQSSGSPGELATRPTSWAWHDRVGYAFLGAPANARLACGPQKGRWSDIGVGS